MNLELLVRGLEAGKVPISSFVRHEAWKVWRPVYEIAEITNEDGEPIDLARLSYEPGRSTLEPGPPDDGFGVNRPSVPAELISRPSITPLPPAPAPNPAADVVASASDRRDALLLLLAAAVARGRAEVAMIHEVADEGAVAVCAHGPQVFEALGLRTRLLDPALIDAAAGVIVISEPTPGPSGQAIIERLSRLGVPVESAVMLPIRPRNRLFGIIEVGRRSAFRPSEVAGLEKLVDALVFKLETIENRRQQLASN